MKKRWFVLLCASLLSATLFVILTACGAHGTGDGSSEGELAYTLSEDGESYTVTGVGTAKGKHVTIASEYNGKPVTAIGRGAFQNTFFRSVTIPDSVTRIEDAAFSYAQGLCFIIIPESVTEIGENAFYNAYRLCSVIIYGDVARIEKGTFARCGVLASVTLFGLLRSCFPRV